LKITYIPKKKWQELSNEEIGGKRDNTVCLIRYGGFGDQIQISSIFPLIKAQGKKVCVNVTENGYDILKNDPNIDELLIQETDQIPNEELGEYWKRLRKVFPSVINLSCIVEQGLLALPDSPIYNADKIDRHKKLNKNYVEALHRKAKVPQVFNTKFYPSLSEKKWAAEQRRNMRLGSGHYVIVVALSGSSVHKSYPYMDSVIAYYLMEEPMARFVLVGEELCKLLEAGWEKEPKVFCKSGDWSIRQSLAFAQTADLVLGPETGVLNSVSAEDIAKVVMLSHSSEENLTKHWVNTTAVYSDADCYPCHKLHYGFATCNRHEETGGAMCAARLDPKKVVDAIDYHWNLKNDISRTLSNS
jgi:ADP-heptose:LPS heptosyltransferase